MFEEVGGILGNLHKQELASERMRVDYVIVKKGHEHDDCVVIVGIFPFSSFFYSIDMGNEAHGSPTTHSCDKIANCTSRLDRGRSDTW